MYRVEEVRERERAPGESAVLLLFVGCVFLLVVMLAEGVFIRVVYSFFSAVSLSLSVCGACFSSGGVCTLHRCW